MGEYYLAIDIGASSGRHMLGHMENGHLVTEEIYRFTNGLERMEDGFGNTALCWDADGLFSQIKEGMKRCKQAGKIPVSVSIDTWGVDFVLLNRDRVRIGNAVGYRDMRTQGMDSVVERKISM